MQIKIFESNIKLFGTTEIEKKVNSFVRTHNVISITPACTGEYLTITVVYKEESK